MLEKTNDSRAKRKSAWLSKVLITSQFNDKILDDHFLVHKGCVIMMFYVPQEPKSGHIIELTGDKYFTYNTW